MHRNGLDLFAACGDTTSNILALPNWYRNLPCDGASPKFTDINQVWVVVANIVEIMLRLGGLIAVGFIIYGGISYIISQGNPERITQAKDTIVNAVVGLVIAVMATALVSFIAGIFS